jgi:hypothetical protein
VEWGIEADAQRLLLAAAAAGDREATGGGGGLPLEEDEAATLRACGLADGAELLLTLQDAAQGAARRELRGAARRQAAEWAEVAERKRQKEQQRLQDAEHKRAEFSALRGAARTDRRRALKRRTTAELSEPQREFLSREAARMASLRWTRSAMLVVVLALVALLIYATSGCGGTDCGPQGSCSGYPVGGCTCEDGAHLDGWARKNCENVTTLDLSWTGASGDVSGLAPLTQLKELDLSSTGVSGDVSGLAPLTQLTQLDLSSTSASGDVSGLAPLTQLASLYLSDTSVSGDVSGLAPLTQLTVLSLHNTSVRGDVSGLAPLTQLTVLYLQYTSVSGDVSGLAPLTQLTNLDLQSTSVCGQRGGRDYGTC